MMHFLKNVLKKYYFYHKYGARVSARASIPINTIIGKNVVIGKGTTFTDKVEIGNETEIAGDVSISGIVKIGKKCRIGRDVTIDSKKFYLGDYSLIYAHNYFDNKRLAHIVIGRFCQIASGCEFRNVEHDITNLSTYPLNSKFKTGNPESDYRNKGDIIIGNDVWLAHNVTIVKGVVIGDGTVIAAGSILTQNVPPYAVVAGVPAKIIRYRFDEDKIKQLLKIKWWDWEEEKIKKFIPTFCNDFTQKEIDFSLFSDSRE